MAGGRRNASRSAPQKSASADQDVKKVSHSPDDGPPLTPIIPPKHMPIPEIPRVSELTFEALMLIFGLIVLALQYLNIYRTVFWLSHSHTKYAMNFYLVDMGVVWFIVITLSRRLIWSIIKNIIVHCFHSSLWKSSLAIARIVLISCLFGSLAVCVYAIEDTLTYIKILALAYPFGFYVIFFDLEMSSFLEVIPSPLQYKEDSSSRNKQAVSNLLHHSCMHSADAVREEVENLTKDCNKRFAQVMYQTFVMVYYTTLMPCFFVPPALHYDMPWVTYHVLLVLSTSFLWHLIYCYPAKYCDVIHRSTLHLGGWVRVEGRSSHAPYNIWSQTTLWPQGALVKHLGVLYRAEGITNTAEPGNTTHYRLYQLFSEPSRILFVLVSYQLLVCLLHLGLLASLHQWQQVLATAIVLAASYAALYLLLRDYLILRKVYQLEQQCQEKAIG